MIIENATIAVVLFKSKTLSNGEHPIMLRITKNRKRSYVSLKFSCAEKDWNADKGEVKKSHSQKDKYNSIIAKVKREHINKLVDFKQEGKDFTPDMLIAETFKPTLKTTVYKYFDLYIERLKTRREIGNAKVYADTYAQLQKFTCGKDLLFSQLDYKLLINFEADMKSRGLTDNGMSVRFRTLRALFNAAIDENYVKRDCYPFGKFKITGRFSTKTQKRAITKADLKKIEALELKPGSAIFEAQQYFLFSYYGQGINFADIAQLRWSNIIGDRVSYRRAKTGGEINFTLQAPALQIIGNLKQVATAKNDYIFPVLNDEKHKTPMQKHNRIHKVITRVNKQLKTIATKAEIDVTLTTYVARHTFATVLKHSGISTAIISESMGHQTEAITQTYLKSFHNSVIDEAMKNLL